MSDTISPVKSPSDKKLYKYLRLPNGLTALLISDPEIKKSGQVRHEAEQGRVVDGEGGGRHRRGHAGLPGPCACGIAECDMVCLPPMGCRVPPPWGEVPWGWGHRDEAGGGFMQEEGAVVSGGERLPPNQPPCRRRRLGGPAAAAVSGSTRMRVGT